MRMPCWPQFSGWLVATQPLPSSQPLPLGLPASLFPRSLTLSFSFYLPLSRSPAIDRTARFQLSNSMAHGIVENATLPLHSVVQQYQQCGVGSPICIVYECEYIFYQHELVRLSEKITWDFNLQSTRDYFGTVLAPNYNVGVITSTWCSSPITTTLEGVGNLKTISILR